MNSEKSKSSSRSRRSRGRGRKRKVSFGKRLVRQFRSRWMVVVPVGLTLAALLLVGARYVRHHRWAPAPAPLAVAPVETAAVEPAETAAPVEWRGLQPEQIAKQFLAASTHEERLRWVRQPAEVAEWMERYFRDGPGASEKVADIRQMGQSAAEDQVLERFVVTMEDGSRRLLCVPFNESGGKVDFKSYARHCSNPWSEVLDGTVAKASEMRVFLEPGNYYNHEFADDRQWLCLIASSPDLENPIYLYARRDLPELMGFIQNPPKAPQRCVVAIENPGEGHRNRQWQLTRVVPGWVVP